MKVWVGALSALALLSLSGNSSAVEREHHVGLDLGGAALAASDKTEWGGAAGAHYAYGLSDAWNLVAEASGALLSLKETGGPGQLRTHPTVAVSADVGVGYVFDVLQWVPYAGLLVGGTTLAGGTLDGAKPLPDIVLALGLDYRVDRSLSVGIAVRERMLLTDLSVYPDFTEVFARIERTWGW